ncbi:hypothetical protein PACTADRAFT_48353 [Pachysolen tannophilus NRRL Y-2460]|uniref:NUDE domain-containing protein n=1 Tax=Pachysolen tannophilus NRRL Y-2460 TaxID=669874 RepID=A0A1E4U3Q2_PACTA|nr:hypothetical protein PACTADRAFT_48353 [Pachysolen tannophilus NRRL Y-2460]
MRDDEGICENFEQLMDELSYEEAVKEVVSLRRELQEFENSSKELEDALELEIQDLNNERNKLRTNLQMKNEELNDSKKKIMALENELMQLSSKNNDLICKYEQDISQKKSKLIQFEIESDNLETDTRILNSKLQTQQEINNELLEKNIILQYEISEINHTLNNEKLENSNNQIKINELLNKINILSLQNERYKVIMGKPRKVSEFNTPPLSSSKLESQEQIIPKQIELNDLPYENGYRHHRLSRLGSKKKNEVIGRSFSITKKQKQKQQNNDENKENLSNTTTSALDSKLIQDEKNQDLNKNGKISKWKIFR